MGKLSQFLLLAAALVCVGSARAELVVVVSAQSPVEELSVEQVADIYLAKEVNFPGGSLALPMDMRPASALRKAFYRKVVRMTHQQLRVYWTQRLASGSGQPPKEVDRNTNLKKLIAENPNTIGYINRSEVDASVRVVTEP